MLHKILISVKILNVSGRANFVKRTRVLLQPCLIQFDGRTRSFVCKTFLWITGIVFFVSFGLLVNSKRIFVPVERFHSLVKFCSWHSLRIKIVLKLSLFFLVFHCSNPSNNKVKI